MCKETNLNGLLHPRELPRGILIVQILIRMMLQRLLPIRSLSTSSISTSLHLHTHGVPVSSHLEIVLREPLLHTKYSVKAHLLKRRKVDCGTPLGPIVCSLRARRVSCRLPALSTRNKVGSFVAEVVPEGPHGRQRLVSSDASGSWRGGRQATKEQMEGAGRRRCPSSTFQVQMDLKHSI